MFDKLIDLLVQFIHLFQVCFIVHSYQRGVVLRWGRFHRKVGPGFHWLWPFNVETHLSVSIVPETILVGPQSLTTEDGVSVIVSTMVMFSIADERKFLLDVEGGHKVIEDCTYGVVARFILERTWDKLQSLDMSNELEKVVRRRVKSYGVEIESLGMADFTRSRSIRLMPQLNSRSHGSD